MKKVQAAAAFSLILAGCAAAPKANLAFTNSPTPMKGQTDSYAFPRTFVDIKGVAGEDVVSVTPRNQAHEEFRVAIASNDSWGVKTAVGLVKITNSDMLDEAGVDTKDLRTAAIQDAGKLILGVLPFLGLAADAPLCAVAGAGELPKADLPTTFDTLRAFRDCAIGAASSGSDSDISGWRAVGGMRVWFGPLPPDAAPVNTTTGFTSLATDYYRRGIVYAACREVRLSFKADKVITKTDPVTKQTSEVRTTVPVLRSVYVADPRYFRFVAFPYKGKIKVHPQCGTSVTTDPAAGPTSDLVVAAAVLEQAKAIKEALEKKEDE